MNGLLISMILSTALGPLKTECVCRWDLTTLKEYNESDWVGLVEIEKVELVEKRIKSSSNWKQYTHQIVTARILKKSKGSKSRIIEFEVLPNPSMCGFELSSGQEWQIFLLKWRGTYKTDACAFNRELKGLPGERTAIETRLDSLSAGLEIKYWY